LPGEGELPARDEVGDEGAMLGKGGMLGEGDPLD
jgi:hypothetical protein